MSKDTSNTLITDPKIEPFYISKDAYCYTIFEKVIPNPAYSESTKEYIRSLGHYSNFGACLKELAKLMTDSKSNYESIADYIKEYRQIEKNINELINIEL